MGSVERPSYFGDMEAAGIGHMDACGIHTDLVGDDPIGPVRLCGDLETPPKA
ncbi:MAG: hypothetical protein ABW250_23390 [Pyrinomonadaceae bacterium]